MGRKYDSGDSWLKFYCGLAAIGCGLASTLVGIIYYSISDRVHRLEEFRLTTEGKSSALEQRLSYLDRELQELRRK